VAEVTLPTWWTHTIVRIRPGATTDRYATTVPDWSAATELNIDGCFVSPLEGTDLPGTLADRDGLIRRRTARTPPGADIRPGDRIRWDGGLWSVVGDPLPCHSPTGGVDHTTIRLHLVEG
jgi:hypothetical protein